MSILFICRMEPGGICCQTRSYTVHRAEIVVMEWNHFRYVSEDKLYNVSVSEQP